MKILIIGGDERFISLENTLRENKFNTETLFLNSNDKNIDNINDFDLIILPIPFLKNNYLNSPFIDEKIPFKNIMSLIKDFKGKIIGGLCKNSEKYFLDLNLDFENILKDEIFTLTNAIITAEGTIKKLIEESPKSLFELKISITGYGRVSRALSRRLNPLCRELTVYNNYPSINFTHAKIDNIKIRDLLKFKEEALKFNIIINTIPSLIINKNIIDTLKKDTLILDLSSMPGGVDFEYAKEKNIKTIHYLGVPSKVSKLSSSNAIFNFLKEFLK